MSPCGWMYLGCWRWVSRVGRCVCARGGFLRRGLRAACPVIRWTGLQPYPGCCGAVVVPRLIKGPVFPRRVLPPLKLFWIPAKESGRSVSFESDYLANAGCLRPLKRIEDKDLLVEDIMFQVVHQVNGALQRFREGMKTLGVLDPIRMPPDAFRPLSCHEPSPLTADVLEQLFEIRLSAVGSNKRRAEECVVAFWRDYLMDV